jgi:hypothetical protein
MTVPATYNDALHSDRPTDALHQHVRNLFENGYSRDHTVQKLEDLYVQLLAEERGAQQDAVADVLDALVGWSSPSAKL